MQPEDVNILGEVVEKEVMNEKRGEVRRGKEEGEEVGGRGES